MNEAEKTNEKEEKGTEGEANARHIGDRREAGEKRGRREIKEQQ